MRPRPSSASRTWRPAAFFFLLALALYANTLGHGYALDDSIVITENVYTQRGLAGLGDIFGHDTFRGYFRAEKNLVSGGRYRPLSLATFALERQLLGANPRASHAVNVLLYGLTGALLYLVLLRLMGGARGSAWLSLPFLATLVFVTHPLHTEVVANIKGRDELLALLFALGALWFGLRYADARAGRRLGSLLGAGACFFLALLAKESAAPFLVLVPLALWFFRPAPPRRLVAVAAALAVPAALYLVLRAAYAGPAGSARPAEILNDPFLGASAAERVATVCKCFGIYLRLFLFPHPLSHDYYYDQVPITSFGSPSALVPLALALALGAAAAAGAARRSPLAFGLLFFAASFSIVSNLFFSVGTMLAERFLYIPSLGLAIALVAALPGALRLVAGERAPRVTGIVVLGLCAAFSLATVLRNPVWKDNLTLFTTDVRTSPRSAKLQTAVGGVLADAAVAEPDRARRAALLRAAIAHLERAVAIYPRHALAWVLMGNARLRMGDDQAGAALACYRQAISCQPDMAAAYKNVAVVTARTGDYRTALASIRRYRALEPGDSSSWLMEADYLETLGVPDSAMAACEEVLRAEPRNARALGLIGMIWGKHRGNYAKAIEYLGRALAVDPNDAAAYENLGVAQAMNGQPQAAVRTFEQGLARFPASDALKRNLGLARRSLGDSSKASGSLVRSRRR